MRTASFGGVTKVNAHSHAKGTGPLTDSGGRFRYRRSPTRGRLTPPPRMRSLVSGHQLVSSHPS